jgi:acyl carrier protein
MVKMNGVLADEFEIDRDGIAPDADIKQTLQLDSLSLVDLVASIEGTFGVSMKGAEVANIRTFGELYDLVFELRVKN